METLNTKNFRFAEFELDGVKRLLLRNGEPLSLNPKAFELLLVMVESRGHVLTKDELLDKVWPDQIIEEGNLKVHISTLRKVLGQSGNDNRFIVTVPGRGYTFVADLEDESDGEVVVESHTYSNIVVEQKEEMSDIEQPRSLDGPTRLNRMWLLFASAVLIVAVTGSAYWFLIRNASASAPIKSVAVMPFTNDSGNTELDYVSDGMTESLINSLSKLPNISVKARSSMFRYKGKDTLPTELGTDLNVQTVLTGRIVARGEQFILYVSLVDTHTGNQIWGSQYDRNYPDLLSVQNLIARDVSKELKTKLSGADEQQLAKHYTENANAFQLYLRGRYFWNKFTPADHLKAIEYFKQAIAEDPGYALAYAGLADTYGASATNGWIQPKEGYLKAKAAAKKALEIDDVLVNAHATLGAIYMFSDFNWEAAEREYKLAIEQDPNYELTHQLYSYLLTALKRHDEAIVEAQRALELDPLSATLSDDLALAYCLARRYDEAFKQNMKTLEIEPDRPDTIYRIGNIYQQKGMYEEAIAAYEKAMGLSERTSSFLGPLGHAYAASGKKNQAQKILEEMKEMSRRIYVSPYDLAILYAGLGAKEKAIEQLGYAYADQSGWIIDLQVDPFFDDLHDEPGFHELATRAGL